MILFLLPNLSWPQEAHQITGQVLDDTNTPIPSVEVKIYRDNRKLNETSTDPNGNYTLKFEKGNPIDTLSYYHSKWNPGTITGLSGARDHKINKILYKIGSKLMDSARLEAISAVETLYIIDFANKVPRDEIVKKYEPALRGVGVSISTLEGSLEMKDLRFKDWRFIK
jgi:hypothetical protein